MIATWRMIRRWCSTWKFKAERLDDQSLTPFATLIPSGVATKSGAGRPKSKPSLQDPKGGGNEA